MKTKFSLVFLYAVLVVTTIGNRAVAQMSLNAQTSTTGSGIIAASQNNQQMPLPGYKLSRRNEKDKAACGNQPFLIPGIVARHGELFSGSIGSFGICHGNQVISWGGYIDWGDCSQRSTAECQSGLRVRDPFYQGIAEGDHTYLESKHFQIFA